MLTSYVISPAVVKIPGTDWTEKTLVWLSINMPTGSTKSALYQYLNNIILRVKAKCKCSSRDPAWLLGDATCEKMGDLMASNKGRLLGLYDELITFLSQLKEKALIYHMNLPFSCNFIMATLGHVLLVRTHTFNKFHVNIIMCIFVLQLQVTPIFLWRALVLQWEGSANQAQQE